MSYNYAENYKAWCQNTDASRTIQHTWRTHHARRKVAASVIQRQVRRRPREAGTKPSSQSWAEWVGWK